MMSSNGTQEHDHFILKLEIGTADMCPLETLQVDLLEPVDKQIAVIDLQVFFDFSLTVKAAPHECVIRTGQP